MARLSLRRDAILQRSMHAGAKPPPHLAETGVIIFRTSMARI
jgi:hypothetical protein